MSRARPTTVHGGSHGEVFDFMVTRAKDTVSRDNEADMTAMSQQSEASTTR